MSLPQAVVGDGSCGGVGRVSAGQDQIGNAFAMTGSAGSGMRDGPDRGVWPVEG